MPQYKKGQTVIYFSNSGNDSIGTIQSQVSSTSQGPIYEIENQISKEKDIVVEGDIIQTYER
ncbi:hypothetical protein BDV33DRAFT_170904 [Aspergillus novoparasiticus]|uniref:Hypervirulence associated protein TUDOR domain-containing protein n=1 Tax=Aspergillus novoparasiticus TaxID=986946 RepID=A0A5N6EUE6_9EURO|nr:hypothetical protein BDV33DRAFT_170904 [Aspergillus novoparasiticus]